MSVNLNPLLNYEEFKIGLEGHPDRNFVDYILNGIKNGVSIGYHASNIPSGSRLNWNSCNIHFDSVLAQINRDLFLKRKIGPLSVLPRNYVCSPLGAFKRNRSKKVRVIHDLSWPPGHSVNDGISKEEFSMTYISIRFAIDLIKQYGKGTLLAKVDLADAYKQIRVRKEDWPLLGSHIEVNGEILYFVDTVLPFGLRSSAKRFSDYADAVAYIMKKYGTTDVDHYLDDYLTGGPPNSQICERNLQIMLTTCDRLCVLVNPDKIIGPTTCLEFLGLIIDSIRMEVRISYERLLDTVNLLRSWSQKRICTLRELLSLIGKLTFISQVVFHSRTFIRGLINGSKKLKHLQHRIRLSKGMRLDIDWWLRFLPQWNGVSVIKQQEKGESIHIYTDASDYQFGCYIPYLQQWISSSLPLPLADIVAKELYAVCVTLYTWPHILKKKSCVFHCDNMAVVSMIKSHTTKHEQSIVLLRSMFFVCSLFDISIDSEFIPTEANIADSLSRGMIAKFVNSFPNARNGRCSPIDPDLSCCGSL